MSICVTLPGSPAKKSTLRVGTYKAQVTTVEWADDYGTGKAFRVKYSLLSENGEKHDYSELFYNDPRNKRSAAFFDYLEANGIPLDAIDEFVGCREEIVLKKSTRGRFLTIDERTFLGGPNE